MTCGARDVREVNGGEDTARPLRLLAAWPLLLALGRNTAQILLAAAVLLTVGCSAGRDNPSFDLSPASAELELEAMHRHPKPLKRPVVVIDGYLGTGISASVLAGNLRQTAESPAPIMAVSLFWCTDFDECRQKLVSEVEAAFPSTDPHETTEVDVVGISMGGLAARYAALPPDNHCRHAVTDDGIAVDPPAASTAPSSAPVGVADGAPVKRLKIARLFTLASPHQGAVAADLPFMPPIPTDMRRGSLFLERLNACLGGIDYGIIPYGRLGDSVVGVAQTAPPGQTPIWVPVGPLQASHNGIATDLRITADIARRLRGESPFAREPRSSLPAKETRPSASASRRERTGAAGGSMTESAGLAP